MTAAAIALLVMMAALLFFGIKQRPINPGGSSRLFITIQKGKSLRAHTRSSHLTQHVKKGKCRLGTRKRNIQILRLCKCQRNIFAKVLGQKPGSKITLERLGCKFLKCARRAHAGRNHLKCLFDIQSSLLSKSHRICIANHARRKGNLIAQFGDLTHTCFAHAINFCRKRFKKRSYGLNIFLFSSGDKRERSGLCTGLTAGNRTIYCMLVVNLCGIMNIASQLWRRSCQINHPSSTFTRTKNAVRREIDILNVARIPDHSKNHIGIGNGIDNTVSPMSSLGEKSLSLRSCSCVYRHIVSGIKNMLCNGRTHYSRTNKGDFGTFA